MVINSLSKTKTFLLPNEQIVFQANPHWLFLLVSMGQIFLFFFLYYFFACPFLGFMAGTLGHYCYIAALMILVFISLIYFLDWRFNRLYLTNYRLIRESGIIGKRYMSVRLENIEDMTCTFGILGRILGYGDLGIESAGTHGQMVFKGIPKPRKMKTLIERWRFYSDVRR
jgi:uncharacterized membrane protein YdbT with pleckstrin-like domain